MTQLDSYATPTPLRGDAPKAAPVAPDDGAVRAPPRSDAGTGDGADNAAPRQVRAPDPNARNKITWDDGRAVLAIVPNRDAALDAALASTAAEAANETVGARDGGARSRQRAKFDAVFDVADVGVGAGVGAGVGFGGRLRDASDGGIGAATSPRNDALGPARERPVASRSHTDQHRRHTARQQRGQHDDTIAPADDRVHYLAMVAMTTVPLLRQPQAGKAALLPAVKARSKAECTRRCGANGFCDPSSPLGCGGEYCLGEMDVV